MSRWAFYSCMRDCDFYFYSATLMAFLLELLKSSVAMQEQMLGGKGFLVIGYLLEKVCKSLHKILPLFSYHSVKFSNLTCVTTPVKIRSTIKVFWNRSIKNKIEKFRQFCLQVHLLVRAGTAFIKAAIFRLDASLISHISTRHRFHKSVLVVFAKCPSSNFSVWYSTIYCSVSSREHIHSSQILWM